MWVLVDLVVFIFVDVWLVIVVEFVENWILVGMCGVGWGLLGG